ncbi:single stranded DNA-binding protein [Synechococcus T7-like virus S-TIP28]|uniref:Single stranded DNA-binding protein n=1 Tax=Synechococcus T7-like virus S-TIP28 TaxID=1332140 RepID=A0AAE8XEZ3_9CAUD|nr:single stranded DNA-binding protein [Synechococcus T7-like virus S-TIP28]
MANRYKFQTVLEGFVSVGEDSGKFNNRTFAYAIPHETLTQVEADREELIKWAKSKASGRVQEAMTPWDDAGVCKYTYGAGDGSRKPKPEPIFVDTDGQPIEKSVLLSVRKGTKVNLIVDQKPYAMGPNVGTSMRVVGVQIVELASGNGAVDSGNLSVEDVASMFGSVDGFKASEPAVRKAEETVGDGESYDF